MQHTQISVCCLAGSDVTESSLKKQQSHKNSDEAPLQQSASNKHPSIIVPFQYDPVLLPYIVVQVDINGHSLPFIVDTGTDMPLLIDTAAAQSLKLPRGKRTVLSGKRVIFSTKIASMRFLGVTGQDVPYAQITDLTSIDDNTSGTRVAGVIGLPLLRLFTIQIDFTAKTLTLIPMAHPPFRLKGASVLPMKSQGGGYTVALTPANKLSLPFMIDTGSELTGVPAKAAEQLPFVSKTVATTQSVYGVESTVQRLLSEFQVGAFSEPDVVVNDNPPYFPTAIIGLNVLARFNVTLDFHNNELLLIRSPDYPECIHLVGHSGIVMKKENGYYYVSTVEPESPAALTGIQPGYRLISIDNHLLAPLSASSAYRILNGFANTSIKLVVKPSNGIEFCTSFKRDCLLKK